MVSLVRLCEFRLNPVLKLNNDNKMEYIGEGNACKATDNNCTHNSMYREKTIIVYEYFHCL